MSENRPFRIAVIPPAHSDGTDSRYQCVTAILGWIKVVLLGADDPVEDADAIILIQEGISTPMLDRFIATDGPPVMVWTEDGSTGSVRYSIRNAVRHIEAECNKHLVTGGALHIATGLVSRDDASP